MAIDSKTSSVLRVLALSAALVLSGGCAQAQKSAATTASNWFDGQQWVAVTDAQGPAQAAGGVVVVAPVAQAAALQAALVALGLSPRPLAVAGAYEVATPAGADALLLTHRLTELPQKLQVPVQIAPNWRATLKSR
jgi:hypothetical protein